MNKPKKWVHYVSWAKYWYKTSYNSSAGVMPFEALYGRQPQAIPDLVPGNTTNKVVDHIFQDRDSFLRQLKSSLSHAQQRMKDQADKGRKDLQLNVVAWVLVKLLSHRQQSVTQCLSHKLSLGTMVHFKCRSRLVKLQARDAIGLKTHPVFHVSLLRPFHCDPSITPLVLPKQALVDSELDRKNEVSLEDQGNDRAQAEPNSEARIGETLLEAKSKRIPAHFVRNHAFHCQHGSEICLVLQLKVAEL